MINIDAVDFSEHHSEEVMFLLTLSVVQPRHILGNSSIHQSAGICVCIAKISDG